MSLRRIKYYQKIPAVILAVCMLWGCSFRDSLDDCGLHLRFIYDYNMAYADAAPHEVDRIDVFVFDAEGKYLFTKTADREELVRTKYSMSFFYELGPGTYTFLTWGGLSDDFTLKNAAVGTSELTVGETRVEDVHVLLTQIRYGNCDRQLHPLWYGAPMTVKYEPRDRKRTHKVSLVKNTNRINLVLHEENKSPSSVGDLLPYTFEITATGHEEYDSGNHTAGAQEVSFIPYRIAVEKPFTYGELNTMRLLADQPLLIKIRSSSDNQLWLSTNLMTLLQKSQPGDIYDFQEYLDRQDTWELIFNYRRTESDAFTALEIYVNGWLVWNAQEVEL